MNVDLSSTHTVADAQSSVLSPQSSTAVVDAAVHPQVREADELREYLREPFRSQAFPRPERYFYPAPKGEWLPEAKPATGLTGSDPELLERQVLDEWGASHAILLPLTRGLIPDLDLAAAICAATNDWLATIWLTRHNRHGRFRGSIRVNPGDPQQAVREIERWAGHPSFVQVAVPLQSLFPYGHRQFLPIWEAAARHDLPVAIHADGGASVDLPPTPAGFVTHFAEYSAYYRLNGFFHLASLIAEGVFERFETLKFVFADGGFDSLAPLMWRMDKNWRPTRHETPWLRRLPSAYLRDHVRFCAHRLEGPRDPAQLAEWLEIGDGEHLLLFASNYPTWDSFEPAGALADIPEATRRRIMGENARDLYRLPGE